MIGLVLGFMATPLFQQQEAEPAPVAAPAGAIAQAAPAAQPPQAVPKPAPAIVPPSAPVKQEEPAPPEPEPAPVPAEAVPEGWALIHKADLDVPDFREFDEVSVQRGSLASGEPSVGRPEGVATATVDVHGRNGYSRAQWSVSWGNGSTFRTEMDVFLPDGFYENQDGAVQLLGWDTFPVLENQMRLIIWSSDGRTRLFQKVNGRDTQLTNTFHFPEGEWVRVVVEQQIGSVGWSKVWLNDQLVAEGKGRADSPAPVTRVRYGLVAVDSETQDHELAVRFDRVRLYEYAGG
jgi:hypothetical protein